MSDLKPLDRHPITVLGTRHRLANGAERRRERAMNIHFRGDEYAVEVVEGPDAEPPFTCTLHLKCGDGWRVLHTWPCPSEEFGYSLGVGMIFKYLSGEFDAAEGPGCPASTARARRAASPAAAP